MTFMDEAFNGKYKDLESAAEDAIDEWHKGGSNMSIYQYLGMTKEEYSSYARCKKSISQLLQERVDKL